MSVMQATPTPTATAVIVPTPARAEDRYVLAIARRHADFFGIVRIDRLAEAAGATFTETLTIVFRLIEAGFWPDLRTDINWRAVGMHSPNFDSASGSASSGRMRPAGRA